MIRNNVLETIKEYKMINKGDSILVGVSGGADSVSLLYCLHSLKEDLKISAIHVAHLNHLIRKEDAEMDQRYVENISKNLGLLCISDSVDVEAYAAQNKLNLEDAGRRLRYAFYQKTSEKVGANKIVLGHTADDMVETFLMRLLRGAGLKGLTGIPPVRQNIVRPLIRTWRKDIEKYTASLKLVPRIDHTNYESKYLRNRVRLKLIPQLKIYNLRIKEILLQTVLLLTEDYLYMESKTREAISEVILKQSEDKLELDSKKLREFDPSITGHLIRTAIEKVKGNLAELSFSHIHNIIKNLDSNENWQQHLPDQTYVICNKNKLTITKELPQTQSKNSFYYTFSIPGEIAVKEAKIKITAEIIDHLDTFSDSQNVVFVDLEEIDKQLIVRSRKSGDRFYPLGMNGAKKVQDFFVDLKIPSEERDFIPIVESSGRIIWIAGFRIDERAKVDEKTKKVVKLTCQNL